MTPTNPPVFAMKLLTAFVPERTAEALSGDLLEHYACGRSGAWLWWQVVIALVVSARREARSSMLRAIGAVVLGDGVAASLCYGTTSLAGRLVRGETAYLLFVPLVFFSAAASGWIVRRSHSRPMVVVYAGFCIMASAVAFVALAFRIFNPLPAPALTFFVAVDFVVGPVGVLAGGFWASDVSARPSAS